MNRTFDFSIISKKRDWCVLKEYFFAFLLALATLIVIIGFIKISSKSWIDVLVIKKQDFEKYKILLLKFKNAF